MFSTSATSSRAQGSSACSQTLLNSYEWSLRFSAAADQWSWSSAASCPSTANDTTTYRKPSAICGQRRRSCTLHRRGSRSLAGRIWGLIAATYCGEDLYEPEGERILGGHPRRVAPP